MPEPHDHCQESYRIQASRSFRKIIDSANACSFDEGQISANMCDNEEHNANANANADANYNYNYNARTRPATTTTTAMNAD